MPGNLYLYISAKDKVFKVLRQKNRNYRAIAELANEKVFFVTINYSTMNRKPVNVQHISFDELQLDDRGGFEYTSKELERILYNFNNYGFMDAERLSQQEIISLPRLLVVLTDKQKQALYEYIEQKYPQLMPTLPYQIEKHIRECKQTDLEHRLLVKQALKIKHD